MLLTAGARLGSYEITTAIGSGGMGEVYRAHDSRLGRDVAIKVLPELFAVDADRVARFKREAQSLAALNHPNIAHVYGLEEDASAPPGVRALVMELVEGEDLSTVVARGPMPPAEAIPIARQIAEGLEAAHEAGIVHRDLKPANVKVRSDGTVKILDFGLAKAMDATGPGFDSDAAMKSPTLTARATQMGLIIGTAAYMAPEQAKGRAVDKRADIWSFGVVLYEMLSGRRAFDGDDISTTLAAVLMRDPDWTALPESTPPALVHLVRRCMERDPRSRLRDIGEARLVLDSAETPRPPHAAAAAATSGASPAPWIVAAVTTLLAVAFAAIWIITPARRPAGERIQASLAPPPGHAFGTGLAVSPDGRRLVLEAINNETAEISLWLRDMGDAAPTRLRGTDGGTLPFWSPDGTEIAFFAEGKLKKIDLQGSPAQVICDAASPRGGAWGPDGTIVLASTFRTGLERVSASGGKPAPLTTLDTSRSEKSHRWPVFLPGGTHILFLAQTGEAGAKDDTSAIEALELSTGTRTRLIAANSSPLFAADGYLLFWREGALRGQAFDASARRLSGAVFTVADGVAFDANEYAQASLSASGTLVYSTQSMVSRTSLVVQDRTGRTVRTIAESVLLEGGIALSPDGRRLAASVTVDNARDTDVWIYDVAGGTSTRLTFDQGGDRRAVWSPDGTMVFYTNDRTNDGTVFRRYADGHGQPETVASRAAGLWTWDVSRDGRWLVVGAVEDATGSDLWRYEIATQKLTPIVNTPFVETSGAISPDDRWLAFQSDESGRPEVYVLSLGDDARRYRISSLGGHSPMWRSDGRELYFLAPQGQLMAVDVETSAGFRASAPRELFRTLTTPVRSYARDYRTYAPLPDGRSFIVDAEKQGGTMLLTFVTSWAPR
ncbi:MAG TPA: protein kinase [Vicinamibacterales bacterium]|nr:protein kinase [Vicinamibacterales bacterium]